MSDWACGQPIELLLEYFTTVFSYNAPIRDKKDNLLLKPGVQDLYAGESRRHLCQTWYVPGYANGYRSRTSFQQPVD